MIELFHWEPVSHSLRVLIALQEVGVKYESHYVDLLEFEQFSNEILDLNPAGQVPILRSKGVAMAESALINEYLAERFPQAGLASSEPLGWYQTQAWSKYVDYNLSSSLATLGCRKYLTPLLQTREETSLNEAIDAIPVAERQPGWRVALAGDYSNEMIGNSERKVDLVVKRMEQILARAEWLVGDNYSIADIDTFAMIHGLRDVAPGIVNATNAPHTLAWHERIAARPAVREVVSKGVRHEPGRIFAPGPEHSRWG